MPYKDGDMIKDGTAVVYQIEKFMEKKTNVMMGQLKVPKSIDLSELVLRDVKRNESFTAVIGQTNYMPYFVAKITRKKDNMVTNLVLGAQIKIELEWAKKPPRTATLTSMDDKERKCVFTAPGVRDMIRYPMTIEKEK
jgi:hypothetical protein